jgi:pimeloyl-ACP methyl ester carboxylesterase
MRRLAFRLPQKEGNVPKATLNGVQLYWERAGESGDSLVLVHGSWGDHHNWDAVVPGLSGSFRVLTYDRRGHSQSERPAGQGSVREDVADLAALIEHLRLGPAHIAGNSFGASIVLRLAGERPDLFRSLIVHEPPLFGLLADDPEGQTVLAEVGRRASAVIELLKAGDNAGGARLFVETIALGPGTWEQLPEPMQRTFIVNAPTWLDETQDPEALTLDLARLATFTRPALVSHGGQSPPFFPRVVAKVAQGLGRAEQHTFAGAGHVPHVSHPSDYVETVLRFTAKAQPN